MIATNKFKLVSFGLLLIFCFCACKNDQLQGNSAKQLEAIPNEGGKIADIIRNPVSADTPLDTINVAKLVFEELSYDFGEVKEGEIVVKTFKFANEGKVPLLISDARSTCGCTVPNWPKNPIEPGGSGAIKVEFKTEGKTQNQRKPVVVTANTYPAQTQIYLQGFVRPKVVQ